METTAKVVGTTLTGRERTTTGRETTAKVVGTTVATGGITVSQGGITVSQGGITVSQGGVTVSQRGITVSQGMATTGATGVIAAPIGKGQQRMIHLHLQETRKLHHKHPHLDHHFFKGVAVKVQQKEKLCLCIVKFVTDIQESDCKHCVCLTLFLICLTVAPNS